MIRSLRPVDTVIFSFYLVLLALSIVADVRNAIWFVARPLGDRRHPLVCRTPTTGDVVLSQTAGTPARDHGLLREAPPPHLCLRHHGLPARPAGAAGLAGAGHLGHSDTGPGHPCPTRGGVLAESFGADDEAYNSSTWF